MNKVTKEVIMKIINHLQEWMSNNPKYSHEFMVKARIKDGFFKMLTKDD